MVDWAAVIGKNTDMDDGVCWVVAGALRRSDGQILMHQRPEGKHHAGLWEYPGGKVEAGETPVNALIRELDEELGVTIRAGICRPVAFAEEAASGSRAIVVILLYTVNEWTGEPAAIEGGDVAWCTPESIPDLDMPPLDQALTAQLLRQL